MSLLKDLQLAFSFTAHTTEAVAVTVTAPVPALLPVEAPPPRRSRSRLLEEALRRTLGADVRVVLTDNRTSMLSQSRKDGVRTVRVHQMFLDAPDEVRDALASYAADGGKASGRIVDAFISQMEHLLSGPLDLPPDAHLGQHHNLLPVFQALNARYFDESIQADLTWGTDGAFRGRSRTSITFGSYDYRAKHITMHPVLDQAAVPALCVARVLHHEMCHAAHPAEESAGGRRRVHTPIFREAEARIEGADAADAWLDENLDALLAFKQPRAHKKPKARPRRKRADRP